MDATELSRWTRFAAKGGIGKCTATHDCVAESPEDLMFLKDDAIIVLMQLPEDTHDGEGTSSGVGLGENGWYLGYCEGVVGRFQGKHVHFHSKLKRPVMTKRSSTASTRSPSRRNSNAHGGPPGSRATTPIQTASPRMSMSASTPPSTSTSSTPDSTPRLPAKTARSIAANARSPSLGSSRSPTPGTNTAASNGTARSSPSSMASSSRHGHGHNLGLGFGSFSSGSISTLVNSTVASTSVIHASPRSSPLVGSERKLLPSELDDMPKSNQLTQDLSTGPPIAGDTIPNHNHHTSEVTSGTVRSPPSELPNPFDLPLDPTTADTAVFRKSTTSSTRSNDVQTTDYGPAPTNSRPSPVMKTDDVAFQHQEAGAEDQPQDRSKEQEPPVAEGRATEDEEDEDYDAPSSSRISRISLAMSDGEVGIGLSLLQDLAGGEGDFGDGEFSSDDDENTGEWRLKQTEAGGEGVQRSASVSSRSTGLGYHDDEGEKMADSRESERGSYMSEQSRYSVDTMSKELDSLESTIARLRPRSSIENNFVMLTPTVGSMVIPPRVSSMSFSKAPSSSSPPTSPHLPATLPLNLTPRKETFSINGTGSNGITSATAPIPSPTSPTFSIRTHASTSTTRTTSTTHTARTTRTGYSGTGSIGSDDWDGAGDIYDDYMYRYSTRLSVVSGRIPGGNGRRGSGGSGASLSVGRDTPPVPQARGSADDVDDRFGGKGSVKTRPGALDIQISNRLRPSGSAVADSDGSKQVNHLDAPGSSKSTSSPLLHTTWGDALSSPEEGIDGLSATRGNPGSSTTDSFFDGRPGAAGFLRSPTIDGPASAIRQRLEMNWGPNANDGDVAGAGRNVQINHTSSSMGSASSAVQEQDDVPTYGVPGGIVVEDDERAPDVSLTTAKMGIGDNSFVSADFEGGDERQESPASAGEGDLRNDWKGGVDGIASPGLPLLNPHDSVDDTLEEITRTTSPVPLDSSLANSTSSDAILLSATAEVAPPPPPQPPVAQLLAPPVSHLRPSLAELRGEKDPDSGMRTSLFLPHPNAPKPTVLSQGPMYIRDPTSPVPPSVAALPYGSQWPSEPGYPPAAANSRYPPTTATAPPRHPGSGLGGLSRALHMAMTSRGILGRGPTLFARCDVDLASSIGPVAITFSPEPFVGPPPGPSNVTAATGLELMPPVSAPGGGVPGSETPARTLSGGSAGPQPDSSSPKPPAAILPTTNGDKVPGSATTPSAADAPSGVAGPSTSVIPRPNFYPKVASARPRSRSFSEFGSTSIEVPMPIASDDNTPLKIPSMRTMARSLTASRVSQGNTTPSPKPSALKLQSSLRPPYAPSPLSIPSSGLSARGAPKSPTSPLSQSSTSFAPPSPTTSSRRHQLRQVTSNPTLAAPLSPRIVVPPSLSRKRSSGASPTSPTQQSMSDRGSISTPPRQNSIPDISAAPSSAASRASVDGENPRGMVGSPTPMVTRQLSLRSKLSLPNLRRKQSRQDDASSIAASSIDNEYETAQAEGMDFELVRPSFSHLHSARTSEDSSFVKDGGSVDLGKPEMTIGGLLRTGSPAMSFSSGQRSPSVADVKTPKMSDSESSSMEGHRQRELRWIALMSSVPASQARKNKKVKRLLVEGVPSSVRYLVWIHLTDGKARNVPKVYEQLVKRGHVPSYMDIERDVQAYIRENSQPATMRESMMSLLQAYLSMVPDVQYSRGLTLIAGNILLLAPEEDGFWTFVSLMDSYLRPYFSSSSSQMEVDAMLFSRALEANDPQVAKKVLTTMSINPTAICFPWFTSLFVNTLPSSYVQRVWDLFLFEGIPFLVRAGLALISTCRRQILEATSPEAVLQLLRHPPSSLLLSSPDAFLSLLNSFKLKDDDFRKQRIKMEAQVKRQTQAPRAPPTSSISLPK